MLSESAAVSRVVCDIYDAAIDPARWPDALQSACAFVGGHQSILYWHDAASEDVDALYRYNDDPEFTRLYVEQYAPLNPVFPAAFFRDVGSVTSASDLVPQAEMQRTRFFKEWLAPQRLTDSLTAILEKERARAAFFAVQWQEQPVCDDARRRMALLVPHFQRAVTIGRLFAKHKTEQLSLKDTLDRIDDGVFLVDARGHVIFANASGQKMIAAGVLLQAPRGILRAKESASDSLLHGVFRSTGDGDAKLIGPRGLTVTLREAATGRWIANILPLMDGARRRAAGDGDAAAAVFVRQSTVADPAPLETLAAAHKLTASEIRVVEAMLRINGLDAMADALGISKATVKTHLNRIYRKCSVKNQSGLIKLVAGIGAN